MLFRYPTKILRKSRYNLAYDVYVRKKKAPGAEFTGSMRGLLVILVCGLMTSGFACAQINVALQANGGVATASSTYSAYYPTAATHDGDRKGLNWGTSGGWSDNTPNVWPDWLQINFNGARSIGEIDVFWLQDNPGSPSEPTPTMTFTLYGIASFQVQYWNGAAWVDVPGGNVMGNNLVWRRFTFAPISTDRIRILTHGGNDPYSAIIEVEAWTAPMMSMYFIHADHLNTPRLITNHLGQAVWRWANDDPFGNNAPNEDPGGLGAFTCNLRLPGQYFDAETGLNYNYHRDYDPSIEHYVRQGPDRAARRD